VLFFWANRWCTLGRRNRSARIPSFQLADVPLPSKAVIDALHIAVAAVNGVEYLLTWNCRHIAYPALRPRIESICRNMGFEPPVICTPQELLEIDEGT